MIKFSEFLNESMSIPELKKIFKKAIEALPEDMSFSFSGTRMIIQDKKTKEVKGSIAAKDAYGFEKFIEKAKNKKSISINDMVNKYFKERD